MSYREGEERTGEGGRRQVEGRFKAKEKLHLPIKEQ